MTMREFDGRVAVVTGAASGMGNAFAERFAREGMKVVLADIEEDALEAAVTRLRQQEFDVIGVASDVAKEASIEHLHERAVAEYGKVHILCNNAGVFGGVRQGPIWDATLKDWEWVFGVNWWGVVHGIKTFLPGMLAHGEPGHIVNTASVGGLVPGSGIYGITKHAVVAYSETLYSQLGGLGANIGVSVLCPGGVNTRILEGQRNRQAEFAEDEKKHFFKESSPVRALVEHGRPPSEIADLVFAAVNKGQFYILTDPSFNARIEARFHNILNEENPPVGLYNPATADAT